jgi:hypothetical protein
MNRQLLKDIEPKLLEDGRIAGIIGHLWIDDLPPDLQWDNAVQVLCADIKALLGHIAAQEEFETIGGE